MTDENKKPATDDGPRGPRKLQKGSIAAALKRTPKQFQEDEMTDVAAALTYYGVLSIFPALIALVSILGLMGDDAVNTVIDQIKTAVPGEGQKILTDSIKGVSAGNGVLPFLLGIAAALWSASGYVGAFGRASNRIYEVKEGRPFWKLRPFQLLITAVMLILLAASAMAMVVSGPIAREVGDMIGLGPDAVKLWNILKLPVILIVAGIVIGILMYYSPNVKLPGFSWVVIGGFVALISWLVASALLAIYFANFANYNKTYGALAGVIAFMFWLWVTNLAMLFGQEFNSELEREREVERGMISSRDADLRPELKQVPED